MCEENSAENQPISAKMDFSSKSNLELLDEIDSILENCTAEDIDMDEMLEKLDVLQERAPVMQGRDAETAWKKMAEEYPAIDNVDESVSPIKENHGHKNWTLRIASAAACILLLATLTANAMGYNPVRSFLRWSKDIVQVFSNPSGHLELPKDSDAEYISLRQALDENGAEDAQCPTWIPRDYALMQVTAREGDEGYKFIAMFYAERGDMVIVVQNLEVQNWASTIEQEENGAIVSTEIDGTTYTVVQNADYRKAYWDDGHYMYSIRGNVTEEELKSILKSMQKG